MDIDWLVTGCIGIFMTGLVVVSVLAAKYNKDQMLPKRQLLFNLRNISFLLALLYVSARLMVPDISIVDHAGLTQLEAPNRFFMEENNQRLATYFQFLDFIFFGLILVSSMAGLLVNNYLRAEGKSQLD